MWPFRRKFPEPEPTQEEVIAAVARKEVTMAHRKWIWKNAMAPGVVEGIKRKDRIRKVIILTAAFLLMMPVIVGGYEVGHSSALVRFTFTFAGKNTSAWHIDVSNTTSTAPYGESRYYAFNIWTDWCIATLDGVRVLNGSVAVQPALPAYFGTCAKTWVATMLVKSSPDEAFGTSSINVRVVMETA